MNRNAVVSVLVLCIALASVVVGVVHFIRRDRAALVDPFAAERTTPPRRRAGLEQAAPSQWE